MKSNCSFRRHTSKRSSNCKSTFFQPKLTINQPGDAYEQEADTVADQVMRSKPNETPFFHPTPVTPGNISRMCDSFKEDEVQRKTSQSHVGDISAPQAVSSVLSATGQPLDRGVRHFMETRLGQDFSQVKIHTGQEAAASAHAINALAFTAGKNIVFNDGQYAPHTDAGKRLLAHELVHVSQQLGSNNHPDIQTYRNPKSMNFGKEDDTNLKEDDFVLPVYKKKKEISPGDKETKPWIEKINIKFDKNEPDRNGRNTWKGNLIANYYANAVALSSFGFDITGGSEDLDITHPVTDKKVTRIEGVGYNSGKFTDKSIKRIKGTRYSVDSDFANMHFAVFFNGGEALHTGNLDESSHGCVHVRDSKMKQLNYHAVVGLTKVTVAY